MEEIAAEQIIKRFRDSWIRTEEFYDGLINGDPAWSKLEPIRDHIVTLKQKGYDNYFRLGTSIHILIISRSVEHGLRSDQKYIKIYPYENYLNVSFREGDKVYREYIVMI